MQGGLLAAGGFACVASWLNLVKYYLKEHLFSANMQFFNLCFLLGVVGLAVGE
jgi:uncharacterized membrane protein